MPYAIKEANKGDHIVVTASGRQTMQDNILLAGECLKICEKHGIDRLLLDIRGLSGQPGAIADYELAKLINTWENIRYIKKTALLEKESDIPSGKFFETAARNHGVNLLVFSDQESAVKWLKS